MSFLNKHLGDYSGEVHLFPFRTEKLSPPAQMVLQLHVGEYVVATFSKSPFLLVGAFFIFVLFLFCVKLFVRIGFCLFYLMCPFLGTLKAIEADSLKKLVPKKFNTLSLIGTSIVEDTGASPLTRFNTIQYSKFLGGSGTAQVPYFYGQIRDNSIAFFQDSYKDYLGDEGLFFQLNSPYTDIVYESLIKYEQRFHVVHSQNFAKNSNIALRITKLKSRGYLKKQSSDVLNTSISGNSALFQKRYRLFYNIGYKTLRTLENGGVTDDSTLIFNPFLDKIFLPVLLDSSLNKRNIKSLGINQFYYFNKPDSSGHRSIYLHNSFGAEIMRSVYANSDPFNNPFAFIPRDTSSTYDSVSITTITHKESIGYKNLIEGLDISIGFNQIFSRYHPIERTIKSSGVSSNLYFARERSMVSLLLNYYVSGYKKDNIDLAFYGGYKFSSGELKIKTTFKECAPDLFYQNYDGNLFSWNNSFIPVRTSHSSISFLVEKFKVELKGGLVTQSNGIYFDTLSLPIQSPQNVNVLYGNFAKEFVLKKLILRSDFTYQSSGNYIRLPEFILNQSVFLRDSIFKNTLPIETGFNLQYTSEYYGNAYNPDLSVFYLQNKRKVGGYPLIDFFIEFKVKSRAKISFRVDHLNEGFSGTKLYTTPGYLIPGRTFRLSVNWRFFE